MKHTLLATVLLSVTLGASSCATIVGTAVSPVTGGVDLVRLESDHWYYVPFIFVGGAIAGPFVAFYNGISFDTTQRHKGHDSYRREFNEIFHPYELLRKHDAWVAHMEAAIEAEEE